MGQYSVCTNVGRLNLLNYRLVELRAMKQPKFAPGFRLSAVDVFVLFIGTVATFVLSSCNWSWGLVPAFVLAHFFLFCNVVRLARRLELLWAGFYVVLAGATIVFKSPGWLATTLASLLVTVIVVIIEMRKPSYHGVGWQRINPELPAWWKRTVCEPLRDQRSPDGVS
jgi:hypothetical protein